MVWNSIGTKLHNNIFNVFLGVLVFLWVVAIIVYSNYQQIPFGEDWEMVFMPAIREMVAGRSPYNNPVFYYPPWILIPLIPLGLLPKIVGAGLVVVIGLIVYVVIAKYFGADSLTLTALLLSPVLYYDLLFGNINWLVMLGLLLPTKFGLFLILAKPQLGIGVAFFWLVETWRKGKIREVARDFLPVSIAFLLSFLLYGFWPLRSLGLIVHQANTSLWPASIPIGLVLLVIAIKSRKLNLAMIASPFLSPYVIIYVWVIALFGLLPRRAEIIAAVMGTWIWILLTKQLY
jgi:hypothetical protein